MVIEGDYLVMVVEDWEYYLVVEFVVDVVVVVF